MALSRQDFNWYFDLEIAFNIFWRFSIHLWSSITKQTNKHLLHEGLFKIFLFLLQDITSALFRSAAEQQSALRETGHFTVH